MILRLDPPSFEWNEIFINKITFSGFSEDQRKT